MPLNTIELENIQIIKSALLELHPHLNVITGTSDNGKSAIVRGAEWTFKNEPQHDFMNWDAGRGEACTFGAEFDDGFVLRSRTKSKNFYQTNLDEDPLEGFGKKVPDDVAEVSRLSGLNVRSQDDPYFLFNKTPGEVARMFNKAVGNEDIDIYFKRVESIISKATTRVNHLQSENKKEREGVEGLRWIDKANEDLKIVTTLSNKVSVRRERIALLSKTINDLRNDLQLRKSIKEWLAIEGPYLEVVAAREKFLEKKKRVENLSGIIKTCYDLNEQRESNKSWLELEEPAEELITLQKKIEYQRNRCVQLKNMIQNMHSLIQKRQSAQETAMALQKEYDEKLKSHGICPTCGRKV